jgi:glycosyltransferase involved in cell wall biosynthesis
MSSGTKTSVVYYDKGGRNSRYSLFLNGKAPSDFFYGSTGLYQHGYTVTNLSCTTTYNFLLKPFWLLDKLSSRLFGITLRPAIALQDLHILWRSDIIISFVDSFSLSIAILSLFRLFKNQKVIGVFHRLSDLDSSAASPIRLLLRNLLKLLLNSLDLVFFMGEPDKVAATKLYKLHPAKTHTLNFGVDTSFWHPVSSKSYGTSDLPYFFSIGQDPNRDFKTLIDAKSPIPIKIHTSHNLKSFTLPEHILVTSGSYHSSSLSDVEVRSLYQSAVAVVVPLYDVVQPSGCSVTLQAMACGIPVILTKTRGLWAPDILIHLYNIILVDPCQPSQITFYLHCLYHNVSLRQRLSYAARQTVLNHFSADLLPLQLHNIFSA